MAGTKHVTIDAFSATFEYDAFADVLTVHVGSQEIRSVEDAPHGILVHHAADGSVVAVELLGFSNMKTLRGDPALLHVEAAQPFDIELPARVLRLRG